MVGLNHQSDLSLIHRDDLVAIFLADSDFSEVQIIIHCCYNIKKPVGMLCIYSTFIIQLLLFAECAYLSTDWPSVCVVLYRSIYNNVSLVPCSPSTELNCFCSSQCCFGKNLLDPWSHVLISCRHPACECFLPLGRNIISICFVFFIFICPDLVFPRGALVWTTNMLQLRSYDTKRLLVLDLLNWCGKYLTCDLRPSIRSNTPHSTWPQWVY